MACVPPEVYESSALFWDARRNGNLLDFRLGVMYKNGGGTGIPSEGKTAGQEPQVRICVQAPDRVAHGLCACAGCPFPLFCQHGQPLWAKNIKH